MVVIGNGYYFMYILIAVIIFIGLYLILRNKSEKVKYNTILIILFVNLAIHFTKVLFEPYFSDLPISLRKITFENICAVSTLIFPFIYLHKGSKFHNYMYFIGIVGGCGALFFPTEAINKPPFAYDTIRFYICHMVLVIAPLLSATLGIYKPDYKKFWTIPLYFIFIEFVILVNEVILMEIGFASPTWEDFFNQDIRNSSFVFGPQTAFLGICKIVLIFVPKIFTKNIFGIIGGVDFYWPVVWLIIPALIYLPIMYLLISLPFTFKNIKEDIIKKRDAKKTTIS